MQRLAVTALALSILALACGSDRRAQVHISRLTDPDSEVRRQASLALVEMGDAAVGPLVASVQSGPDSVVYISAQILGRIGSGRAIPFLRQLTRRDNPFVRREAVIALGQTGRRDLVPALSQIIAADPDPAVRAAAAQSLASLRDTLAVGPLLAALQDSAALVRQQSLAALHIFGGPRAEEAAMSCLLDPDETVRFIAAQVLGTRRAGLAREALCAALSDSSVWVRTEAARALGLLGDSAAVESLVEVLRQRDGPDREAARQALQALTGMDYVVVE